MAELKKGMLKASTLLEIIIAMVIILVVYTLAIGVYNNVLNASPSIKKQQVKAMTDAVISQSVYDENWNDEQIINEIITIEKTVGPYHSYPDLVIITVTASQHGKQLGLSRQIVKRNSHE